MLDFRELFFSALGDVPKTNDFVLSQEAFTLPANRRWGKGVLMANYEEHTDRFAALRKMERSS
jgi:hypothetical protein